MGLAADLSRLIGARRRDGESKLSQLGYSFQGGHKEEGSSLTFFFQEPETGRCLQVVTREGRYTSPDSVDDAQCRSAEREKSGQAQLRDKGPASIIDHASHCIY